MNDLDRKKRQQLGACQDVHDKIAAIKDTIARRDEEMAELRRVIHTKTDEGNRIQADIERQKREQQDGINQFENEKELLFQLKDDKAALQGSVDQLGEKCRYQKEQQFLLEKALQEGIQKTKSMVDAAKKAEQEIMDIDLELNRKNNDVAENQKNKYYLQKNLAIIQEHIDKSRHDKLTAEEFVRRIGNDNDDIKAVINRRKDEIEARCMRNDDVIRGNLRLQDENQLYCIELEETNRRIVLLEEQNRELETELDRFLTSDEDIRRKLTDK